MLCFAFVAFVASSICWRPLYLCTVISTELDGEFSFLLLRACLTLFLRSGEFWQNCTLLCTLVLSSPRFPCAYSTGQGDGGRGKWEASEMTVLALCKCVPGQFDPSREYQNDRCAPYSLIAARVQWRGRERWSLDFGLSVHHFACFSCRTPLEPRYV
jgi:hypothetical protein